MTGPAFVQVAIQLCLGVLYVDKRHIRLQSLIASRNSLLEFIFTD